MTRPFRHCRECFHVPHQSGQCDDTDRFGPCRCELTDIDFRHHVPISWRVMLDSLLIRLHIASGWDRMNR